MKTTYQTISRNFLLEIATKQTLNLTTTIAILLLFIGTSSLAQHEKRLNVNIPGSNDASIGTSNGSFSTVDLSTGSIQPSIPLGTVSGPGVRSSISLGYKYGQGIPVNARAGQTGLGWDLNVGGYILKEQRGISDLKKHELSYFKAGQWGWQESFNEMDSLSFLAGALKLFIYFRHQHLYEGAQLPWNIGDWIDCSNDSINQLLSDTIFHITGHTTCPHYHYWTKANDQVHDTIVLRALPVLYWNMGFEGSPHMFKDVPVDSIFPILLNNLGDFGAEDGEARSRARWILLEALGRRIDIEPDIFHYKFGSHSGKFLFDSNGEIVFLPYTDLRYQRIKNGIPGLPDSSIVFTDNSGTQYHFINDSDYKENTHSYQMTGLVDDKVCTSDRDERYVKSKAESKWNLGRIVNKDGNQVEFEYSQTNALITYDTLKFQRKKVFDTLIVDIIVPDTINADTTGGGNWLNSGRILGGEEVITEDPILEDFGNDTLPLPSTTIPYCGDESISEISYIDSIVDPKRISKIKSRHGYALFNASGSEREDIPSQYPIESIEYYNSNGKLKQRVKFTYSYINSGCTLALCKRLQLDKICYQNYLSVNEMCYEFGYDTSETLPSIQSSAQDIWGFYNGDTTGNIFPFIHFNDTLDTIPVIGKLCGRDIKPNENYSKANILNYIKLPFGAEILYEFEQNTYFDTVTDTAVAVGGLRIKSIETSDGTDTSRNILKLYDYTIDGTNTSGETDGVRKLYDIQSNKKFGAFWVENGLAQQKRSYYLVRFSYSRRPLGEMIRYQNVSVSQPGNGKTEYSLTSLSDFPRVLPIKWEYRYKYDEGSTVFANDDRWRDEFKQFTDARSNEPATRISFNQGFWGLIKSKRLYDESDNKIQREEFSYSFNPSTHNIDTIWAVKSSVTDQLLTYVGTHNHLGDIKRNPVGQWNYRYFSQYPIISSKYFLDSHKTITYEIADSSSSLDITTTNYYSPDHHKKIGATVQNSDGHYLHTKYNYVKDILSTDSTANESATFLYLLKSLGLNSPIETVKMIIKEQDTLVTDASLTIFDTFKKEDMTGSFYSNNLLKPSQILSLQIDTAISDFSCAAIAVDPVTEEKEFLYDDRYYTTTILDEYNSDGALTSSHKLYNQQQSVQYDQESQFKLAEFYNAHYHEAKTNSSPSFSYGGECSVNTFEFSDEYGFGSDDDWDFDEDYLDSINPHTGTFCLKVIAEATDWNNKYFRPYSKTKYKLSAWVRTPTGYEGGDDQIGVTVLDIDNLTPVSGVDEATIEFEDTNGEWLRVSTILDFTSDSLSLSSIILKFWTDNPDGSQPFYIDDIVFQPYYSTVSFSTFEDRWNKPSSMSNAHNLPMSFADYDNFGRVAWIFDKDSNVVKYNQYSVKSTQDTYNYIKTVMPRTELNQSTVSDELYDDEDVIVSKSYKDGLLRNNQVSVLENTPLSKDFVQHYDYDELGRPLANYLPYPLDSADVGYQSNAYEDLVSFYDSYDDGLVTDDNPFSEQEYDESPLNRVVEKSAPGASWKMATGNTQKNEYLLNDGESVRKWIYETEWQADGFYTANSLFKNILTDQDGKSVIEFKDKAGRLICRRQVVSSDTSTASASPVSGDYTFGDTIVSTSVNLIDVNYDTYFIYDDFGRLIYTVPPLAMYHFQQDESFEFSEDSCEIFDELIYAKHYDEKGRLIASKVPGSGWKYVVYNKIDMPLLAQDANLRDSSRWVFTKYDELGRAIQTGLYDTEGNRTSLQSIADQADFHFEYRDTNADLGYSSRAYPTIGHDIHTVNYFDDYTHNPSEISFNEYQDATQAPESFGLITANQVLILDQPTNTYLSSITFYDDHYRPVQTHRQNHLEGIDQSLSQLDFTGNTILAERWHSDNTANDTLIIRTRMTYDHAGRLTHDYLKIQDDPEKLIKHLEYNELGQMIKKSIGYDSTASAYLQNIDYSYNIRGWLTHINNASLEVDNVRNFDLDDVFGIEIDYDAPIVENDSFACIPVYNGNISSIRWKSKEISEDASVVPEHSYSFRYDDINRMTNAYYAATSIDYPLDFDSDIDYYNEKVRYDMAGGISTLNRRHAGVVLDDMYYGYENKSFKIASIEDSSVYDTYIGFTEVSHSASEFRFDKNGNMTTDGNKSLSFVYNHLNMPTTFKDTSTNAIYEKVYNAAGQKLYTIEDSSYHHYFSGIEVQDEEFLYAATSEGRVRPISGNSQNTTDYVFDYYVRDHLGNIRSVLTDEEIRNLYVATMEQSMDSVESELFYNVSLTREDEPLNMPDDPDYTPDSAVSQLNAYDSLTIGHAKLLRVYEGDVVDISVDAFFDDFSPDENNVRPVQNILSQLANIFVLNPSSGVSVAGETLADKIEWADETFLQNSDLVDFISDELSIKDTAKEWTTPVAFLAYLCFDHKFVFDEGNSGILLVTSEEQLEELTAINIEARDRGYIYAYVSNESESDVNFDDFEVSHTAGRVLAEHHYYPYGAEIDALSFHNYYRVPNNYKYSGKEWIRNSVISMYDFGLRYYDPYVGRWHNQDPAEQFLNPYVAMANNPANNIDPDGARTYDLTGSPRENDFIAGEEQLRNPMGGTGGLYQLSPYEILQIQKDNYAVNTLVLHSGSANESNYGYTDNGDGSVNAPEIQVVSESTNSVTNYTYSSMEGIKDLGGQMDAMIDKMETNLGMQNNGSSISQQETNNEFPAADFNSTSDSEKILHIIAAIRHAENNGEPAIDLRKTFVNFPKHEPVLDLIADFEISGEVRRIHINLAPIYKDQRISIDPEYDEDGPFFTFINGIKKEGYYYGMDFHRYSNENLKTPQRMMRIHMNNYRGYEILSRFIYTNY